MSHLTVATVLRSGGQYTVEGVKRLAAEVFEHIHQPYDFVCLTDVREGVTGGPNGEEIWWHPLLYDWPGWWSKMELFRPGVEGRILFLDIDTRVVGDLSEIASYDGDIAMIEDFNQPDRVQSGVMAFLSGGASDRIWEQWIADPNGHMEDWRGDGEWLHDHVVPDRLQDLFPGHIISYRNDCCRPNPGSPKWTFEAVPSGARVICAHGRWKPDGMVL